MEAITETSIITSDPIPLARAALAESPEYLRHICTTMSACGESLRAGQDDEGMIFFARGASDLGQFIQLFGHMAAIARPSQASNTDAFKVDLYGAVKAIDDSITRQDMVALSDDIETRLVPLLQRWDGVAAELESGLAHQVV